MKYILFDLDGTLVDSSEGILRCFAYSFQKTGIAPPPPEELRLCIGPPLLESFLRFSGGNRERALRGVTFYRERYAVKGWRECRLYPYAAECLKKLSESGKILALATSKPLLFAEKILSFFGIGRYFTVVTGSKLDNSFDDKARIIRRTMELLRAESAETVMVGDRKQDVVGAHANGIACVGVRFGFAAAGELESAGAARLAEDFSDLEKILLQT